MFETARSRVSKFFSSGYDAIASSGKRKPASALLKHEDDQLKGRDRRQMIGTGQTLNRNFAILAWAVRKHLDYVTQFDFQMRTENESFNVDVERMFREWFRPANCDAAGRHPFLRMLRMFEARRTIDGDVFALKRASGRLQAIESDLIRQPPKIPKGQKWHNGCQVNSDGRALNWGLWSRGESGNGYEYVRSIPARNIIQHAFFDRFDQVRGITPLAAAYNSFQDVYEGVDYALAKMKVEQLFAMVVTSSASDGIGDHEPNGEPQGYDVDFGRGPIKVEMEPGDDAKFLKSDNPGSNTREFLHTVMGIALKALDLPFNFYDESHTNFFGSRAAWLLYDRSCVAKRADIVEFLRRVTVWRMQLWIRDGQLRLPRGMTLRDIPFEWVHRGMPWWDPAKEIKGDLMAMDAGLDNPYRITKERGRGEFEENILQIARAKEFAELHGVSLSFGSSPQAPQEPANEEPQVEEEQEEQEEQEQD